MHSFVNNRNSLALWTEMLFFAEINMHVQWSTDSAAHYHQAVRCNYLNPRAESQVNPNTSPITMLMEHKVCFNYDISSEL